MGDGGLRRCECAFRGVLVGVWCCGACNFAWKHDPPRAPRNDAEMTTLFFSFLSSSLPLTQNNFLSAPARAPSGGQLAAPHFLHCKKSHRYLHATSNSTRRKETNAQHVLLRAPCPVVPVLAPYHPRLPLPALLPALAHLIYPHRSKCSATRRYIAPLPTVPPRDIRLSSLHAPLPLLVNNFPPSNGVARVPLGRFLGQQ